MPEGRSDDVSREDLLAFLEDPASYAHRPDGVRIVQTHMSYVAIAPPYVYKVKKPVDLGFLDFTTLERRRRSCELEVELNRRLCARIYRGVVPITTRGGTLRFGPDGDIVEYAVEMDQLEAAHFLEERLPEIGTPEIDRVARTLRPFYERQTPTPEVARWGRMERLRVNTDENFAQTEHLVGRLVSRPARDAIRAFTNGSYEHLAMTFARRRTDGRIVDGHGDLHLDHVHLGPDGVCIFDCIEFNERFRYLDVANDLAFLAMDLDLHGRPELARHFVQRMATVLSDPGMLEVMDFYKCYRAFVRAKVEGMRSAAEEVPADEREASEGRARRYYALALRYAVSGSLPSVIVLMGRVGTGKTTQAEALGAALGWPVLSSDRLRKALAGVPADVPVDDATRSSLYAGEMSERTYAALRTRSLEHVERDEGVVLDATYGDPEQRRALRAALRRQRIPYWLVELTGGDETLRERLRRRAGTPGVISDAREQDFQMLSERYSPPDALEDPRHLPVDTEGVSPEDTTREVLLSIVRHAWSRPPERPRAQEAAAKSSPTERS